MFQTTNQYITDKALKISVVISYGLIMNHKWSDLLTYNWFNWYFGPSLHIYKYIYTSKLGVLMLGITRKKTQSPRHPAMPNAAQLRFRLGPPMTNRWNRWNGCGQWVGESISGNIDRFTYKVVPVR